MGDPKTIIEFIGIPGSGKTSLASALATELSKDHDVDFPDRSQYRRPKLSRTDKLKLDLLQAPAFFPYRAHRLCYDIIRAGGPGMWTIKNSWERSRYPTVLFSRIGSTPKVIFILDEWLVHRTIEEAINSYNSVESFVKAFAIPRIVRHRVVYVSLLIDPELARDRILRADNSFRQFAKKQRR